MNSCRIGPEIEIRIRLMLIEIFLFLLVIVMVQFNVMIKHPHAMIKVNVFKDGDPKLSNKLLTLMFENNLP